MVNYFENAKNTKRKKQLSQILSRGFAVETHVHTSEASACSVSSGAALARYYKNLGFDAMMVTDHFFNGNTSIPSHLPWSNRVKLFCRGFDNAYQEGQKIGIKVFFGWEYSYHGTDFLTYGLDRDWLLNHPEILNWSVEEYLMRAREDGAFIIHAHPFRKAFYIKKLRFFPHLVDGVEVINASHLPEYDKEAFEYARLHRLPMTSGSDTHSVNGLPGGGLVFSEPIMNIEDFIAKTKANKGKRLIGVQRLR